MQSRIIEGRPVANEILDNVAAGVARLGELGWHPKLVSITVGDVSAVDLYVRNQRRAAARVGIAFEERRFPAEVSQAEMQAAIGALNVDPRVTGVIVQRPVSRHLSIKALQAAIHPLKDVEGMHPASIGNIVYNELELGPCTALAAVELLHRTGVTLKGLEATVVGHSEIVGKPIAFLLMAEGATVTICHHMTRDLAAHLRESDAVLVAVGKPRLITAEMIKRGAAVIDIGINQVTGEDGVKRVVGDVDYEGCREVAGWITPVPGGVGPVTVAMLMRNALVAVKRQRAHYESRFAAVDVTAQAASA